MNKSEKKFVRNWVYLGMLLVAILAFWAGDWWSWKLIISLPLGIAAYVSIAIPIAGGSVMVTEAEQKKKAQT